MFCLWEDNEQTRTKSTNSPAGSRKKEETKMKQGGWDSPPEFWSAYLSNGEMSQIPEEYWGLPFPRHTSEYTFIGGSEPWRGFDVNIEIPNVYFSKLVCEHWSNGAWRYLGVFDKTESLKKSGTVTWNPRSDWTPTGLETGEGEVTAYWVRFSITKDLSEVTGWAEVIHNSPLLKSDKWDFRHTRVSACDNRPGLKKIYVTVLDENDKPLPCVKVGFGTELSYGIAYDHMNIWGLTDENGYLEWDHLGVPTVYQLLIEDELVITNIRTDLGNEYCRPPGSSWWSSNVPVNRPGIYSYRLEIQKK